MSESVYTESKVAEALGVSRSVVRKVRMEHLTEGEDWLKVRNAVVLTADGLEIVTKAVTGSSGASGASEVAPVCVEAETLKKTVTAAPIRGVVRCVRVVRNPRILLGEVLACEEDPEAVGLSVRVRVRANQNFLPGMELPCYRESWDVWVLDRPCPRWRGRW